MRSRTTDFPNQTFGLEESRFRDDAVLYRTHVKRGRLHVANRIYPTQIYAKSVPGHL